MRQSECGQLVDFSSVRSRPGAHGSEPRCWHGAALLWPPARPAHSAHTGSSLVALPAARTGVASEQARAGVADEAGVGSNLHHLFCGGPLDLDGLPAFGDVLPTQGGEVMEMNGASVDCLGVLDDVGPTLIVLSEHQVGFHQLYTASWRGPKIMGATSSTSRSARASSSGVRQMGRSL